MGNNEFGNAIAQLRKAKGLTQKDLADRLGVSDKAVSRWETGRNYPDIETLQRLAQVLEVSLEELLQGELRLKRKNTSTKKVAAVVAAILLLLYIFPFYNWVAVTNSNFYGARESSYLLFRGLPGHHRQVLDIKKTAEAAFSELGLTEEEAAEKYGLLSRYCITSDLYPEVVNEKHNFRVCSVLLNSYAAESEYSGYMWVYYNQEGLMENGEVGRGAWRVYALWYLERDESGSWYVADIKEGP